MLIYPSDLGKNSDERPLVVFRNRVDDKAEVDKHIAMPMPTSISFADSASYNGQEIGFTGALIMAGASASSVQGAFDNASSIAMSAIPRNMKSLAGLAAQTLGTDSMRNTASVASRTTLNKNVVTAFEGVGTRSFTFNFKLIANSKADSDIMRDIINVFRRGVYPVGTALQLQYPPTWYINFKKGSNEIPYIPKIFESYLTSVNTNYNPSSNLTHADGSPKEIDLSISFTESRALVQQDIVSLESNPFKDGDFIKPYTTANAEASRQKLDSLAKGVGGVGRALGNIFGPKKTK